MFCTYPTAVVHSAPGHAARPSLARDVHQVKEATKAVVERERLAGEFRRKRVVHRRVKGNHLEVASLGVVELRPEHLCKSLALEHLAREQAAQETGIVVRRREEAAAAAVHLVVRRHHPGRGVAQLARLGVACGSPNGAARRLRQLGAAEARIAHAQRAEDVLAHVVVERAARHGLEYEPGPVCVDAVAPRLAGREAQRRRHFLARPVHAPDRTLLLARPLEERRVGKLIAEASRVCEELTMAKSMD